MWVRVLALPFWALKGGQSQLQAFPDEEWKQPCGDTRDLEAGSQWDPLSTRGTAGCVLPLVGRGVRAALIWGPPPLGPQTFLSAQSVSPMEPPAQVFHTFRHPHIPGSHLPLLPLQLRRSGSTGRRGEGYGHHYTHPGTGPSAAKGLWVWMGQVSWFYSQQPHPLLCTGPALAAILPPPLPAQATPECRSQPCPAELTHFSPM